jgi:4-hydroxy-3-methylbut-2-enyl diphosphate reductase
MQVRLADHLGMCFGVRDAIELALDLTQRRPLTILGDLVHNPDVVAQLDAAGAVRVRQKDSIRTSDVLLTAHGVADRVKEDLRRQGLAVHDATCPLVKRAHQALARLVAEGRHPVVVGRADHVEVRGLVGDLDDCTVIGDENDLELLAERLEREPEARLGVVSQTTQPLERVRALVEAMRARWPRADVRFIDTVCQPTKDRQQALRDLVAEADVVVVVGGPDSNNSRKLVELARSLGRAAYLVSGADELRPEWFAGCRVAGLTAGTSTPDPVIAEVQAWLEAHQASNPGGPAQAVGLPGAR